MSFLIGVLWVLMVLVMLVLGGVILLQEGKGGGFAEAFGGVGAETFGVKASGINRFTGILGAAFLILAVAINLCYRDTGDEMLIENQTDPSINSLINGLVPGDGGAGPGDGATGDGSDEAAGNGGDAGAGGDSEDG